MRFMSWRFQAFKEKVKETTDPDKKKMQEGQIVKLDAAVDKAKAAVESGKKDQLEGVREMLLTEAKDLISDWLDRKFGDSVTENSIFSELPRHWEEEFQKDMAALNVSLSDDNRAFLIGFES